MAVSSTPARSGPFVCNGENVQFTFAFMAYAPEHLEVILSDSSGREKVLVLGQHYTVMDISPHGGKVRFVKAPAAGNTITLRRNVPAVQETRLHNQGAFFPEDIERALDLGVMHDQQQDELIERAFKLLPTYEKHIDNSRFHAEAANTARIAAEKTLAAIRTMFSPGKHLSSLGSWLGVPDVIDGGPWTPPGEERDKGFRGESSMPGVYLDLGNRLDGKQVIDGGWRRHRPEVDDVFAHRRVIDLGERE